MKKDILIRENASVYFTKNMGNTVKWFEDILSWYNNIVVRDEQGNGCYGAVFEIPPEIEITREFRNEDNTAYEHCALSVNGEGFLALGEAKNPCDINIVRKYKWETMTFNVASDEPLYIII